MYYPYFRGSLLVLLILLCTCVRAQMIILQQSFELTPPANELSYSTNFPEVPDGPGDDVFGVVDGITNIPDAADGDRFFGAIDVQSPATSNGDGILTFDAGTICNLTSAEFRWSYNAVGLDDGDDLSYILILDGLPGSEVLFFEGESNMAGGATTGGWVETSVSIPGTANTAQLQIILDQNGSDQIGIDNVRVMATGTGGSCNPVCGLDVDPNEVFFNCDGFTSGVDGVTAVIPYSGAETGVTVMTSVGTVGGDNPASVPGGEITISGLTEGGTATVTISGGDCVGGEAITIMLEPPANQCEPAELLINEFLASPSAAEFVEVVSIATAPLDVTGYTFEDATGNPKDFPEVTLQPGEGIVFLLGGQTPDIMGCYNQTVNAVSLNDGGDVIILRNPGGQIVAQHTYTAAEVMANVSQARTPDRDPLGTFVFHNTLPDGNNNSPCLVNGDNSVGLPVELLHFGAAAGAKTVNVQWSTATESNNDRFEVQRSPDGASWTLLGSVPARAGRSGTNDYAFTDEAPLVGINYYRLRQIDLDGTATLYGPVTATFTGTIDKGLYPNPAGNELYLGTPLTASDRAQLLSADGRLLRQLTPTGGGITVGDLRPGLYLLRLERPSGTEVLRFIKR